MENMQRGDLRINGSGSMSGGTFESVQINGSGRVTGALECREFSINGSARLAGGVSVAEKARVSGSAHFESDVKAGEFKVSGSADIDGSLDGEALTVSGSADVQKDIRAGKVKIDGSLRVGGDLAAEEFRSNGSFDVSGLLSADDIDIRLHFGKSHARELGGAKITVRQTAKAGFSVLKSILLIGLHNPTLETDSIEGDEIALEYTKAAVVRGKNITLGAGCEIGQVEYSGDFRKTGDAKVGQEKRI